MTVARVVLVVAAGCGRVNFEPVRCDWHGPGGPRLGEERLRTDLATAGSETDPLLVHGDPLTITVTARGTTGSHDVFMATRPSVDESFGPLVPVFATAVDELALQLDAKGHGYYVNGVTGSADIYEVQRGASGIEVVRALDEINDGTGQHDPQMTRDGLNLWFSANQPTTPQDIMIARRPDPASPWTSVEPFVHNSPLAEAAAMLSADQRVVIWTQETSDAGLDLFFATRAAPTDPWGSPERLGISTAAADIEPSLRDDGCELFFVRSASMTEPSDIYSVDIE